MSTADIRTTLMTAEDLYGLSEDEGRGELVAGVFRPYPINGCVHGGIVSHLGGLLIDFVKAHDWGSGVVGRTGFVVARSPDTVLAPDMAMIRASRKPATGWPMTYWEGAPDLAVEVRSPTNPSMNLAAKAATWLAAGTELVWTVDSESESVVVYTPGAPPRTLTGNDILDGGDLLPGLAIPVKELFE